MKIFAKKYTRKQIVLILLAALPFAFLIAIFFSIHNRENQVITVIPEKKKPVWSIRSIDTMKFSRDRALEKLKDNSYDIEIEKQIRNISSTGATHVAVGTPYDKKFVPYLKRWVFFARKYGLHVWFRGNMSGWEGWFDYPSISEEEHTKLVEKFILDNPDLFEDGDIFSSCPECENGGPGDPRKTGNYEGYRRFLINEYNTTKNAFSKINRKVDSNYFSMNGDVAILIMDKETTRALGGLVVIDHYLKNSTELAVYAKEIAERSGGKVVLGEFGAPIPDLNGKMTEAEQSGWVENALNGLQNQPQVIGLNYWTNEGSSTALWNKDHSERQVVGIISHYYSLR